MIIAATILFILPLIYWLKDNLKKWNGGDPVAPVKHGKESRQKAATLFPAFVLFCWKPIAAVLSTESFWPAVGFTTLIIFTVLLMIVFWWWLFFDGLFNISRMIGGVRLKFFYTGSEDTGAHKDPYSDNFLQRLSIWQHVAIKLGGCVLFTTIYILLLKR